MQLRPVEAGDRAEWLRMLMALNAGSAESDFAAAIHAFLGAGQCRELLPAVVFVLARPAGGLAGFLEVSIRNYAEGCEGAAPYVETWYVDPDVRGRGLGRQLMEAAENWARREGHTELASDADIANVASHRAHGAVGFSEVQRIVFFRKSLR